ncbi:hypothetical protein 8014-B2_00110 [Lactobacillus phage ATCC 8014-B2]|uniref:Uncharacterized protein n=1 Tax=Lactobacillus phage ATCC 8014-B2 TaxID=1225795 RepID=K4I242_9CAUD|nr:hypothetical protein HOQ89_gp036 [Lactobacillus phage ATCC 8014-B2]AFU63177.1 hypothetical protein 8014-B2_00110 [Lactobacillus phage ATCC 8014-B2]
MKYSEARKYIEELSSKYTINMDDGDFNVLYKGKSVGYVDGAYGQYGLYIHNEDIFKKLPFNNKLYMILAELAMTPLDERKEEKKYFIRVFNIDYGYLNIHSNGKVTCDDNYEGLGFKTRFTRHEINQLKQRDDVPLDWNKVTLEECC